MLLRNAVTVSVLVGCRQTGVNDAKPIEKIKRGGVVVAAIAAIIAVAICVYALLSSLGFGHEK